MTAPEGEQKSGEVRSQAGYLEKALECKGLQEMLRGGAGVFTFRYWFINEYINKFGIIGPEQMAESEKDYPKNEKAIDRYI